MLKCGTLSGTQFERKGWSQCEVTAYGVAQGDEISIGLMQPQISMEWNSKLLKLLM
jgi:hypothetical protein